MCGMCVTRYSCQHVTGYFQDAAMRNNTMAYDDFSLNPFKIEKRKPFSKHVRICFA